MSLVAPFRKLLIGGLLSLSLIAAPAQAHQAHGSDIVVPLAALFAFGALYHHGHHRRQTHRHYYRSYKKHQYGHGQGYGQGYSYKPRSHSNGGYHHKPRH